MSLPRLARRAPGARTQRALGARIHGALRPPPALLLAAGLLGCGPEAPRPAEPPTDHDGRFLRRHAERTGCDTCHGVDSCSTCHRQRLPLSHVPGYAGPAHGLDARFAPERCTTCHQPAQCGSCHQPR